MTFVLLLLLLNFSINLTAVRDVRGDLIAVS